MRGSIGAIAHKNGSCDVQNSSSRFPHHQAFAQAYPDIQVEPSVLYVDEGNILTSAGCASGLDACLHLIRRGFGPEAADRAARRMVTPPIGWVAKRSTSNNPHVLAAAARLP